MPNATLKSAYETFFMMLPCPVAYLGQEEDLRVYGDSLVAYASTPYAVAEMIYDPLTNEPFEISIRAKDSSGSYRWTREEFSDARAERIGRQHQTRIPSELIYEEKWYDTDTLDDILSKVTVISRGFEHDHKVVISLDLSEDEHKLLVSAAGSKGLTVDAFVQEVLQAIIDDQGLVDNDPNSASV